jgi:hypothetical protein
MANLELDESQLSLRAIGDSWSLGTPEIERITVSQAVERLERFRLPRGWVFGQTRRLIAAHADKIARRAAASVIEGERASASEIRQEAETILKLADELASAAMQTLGGSS